MVQCQALKSSYLFLIGFRITKVAHDFVLQLKAWILSKGMINSFDSWHGNDFFVSNLIICTHLFSKKTVVCGAPHPNVLH